MRALIVDDSKPVRGILAKMLRELGFETHEARDMGAEFDIESCQSAIDHVLERPKSGRSAIGQLATFDQLGRWCYSLSSRRHRRDIK